MPRRPCRKKSAPYNVDAAEPLASSRAGACWSPRDRNSNIPNHRRGPAPAWVELRCIVGSIERVLSSRTLTKRRSRSPGEQRSDKPLNEIFGGTHGHNNNVVGLHLQVRGFTCQHVIEINSDGLDICWS